MNADDDDDPSANDGRIVHLSNAHVTATIARKNQNKLKAVTKKSFNFFSTIKSH